MSAEEKTPVLVVATLSAFLTPFMSAALNVALPQMGKEFSADGVTLGWVANAYLLAAAMFLVPLGKIADLKGRKRIFMIGTWIFAATSLLLVFAPSPAVVIALRAAQGLGGAMVFGTAVALLAAVYPAGELGRALGINVAAVYLGLSLGPFVGGFLTQQLGWRSIFVLAAILGVATALVTTWKLRGERVSPREEEFDLGGSLLFGVAVGGVIYGFSSLPAQHGFWLIGSGALGLVAFVLWEARARHPVLDLGLFRGNPVFAFSSLAALLHYGATWAVGFMLSLYLQFVKNLSPQETGLVLVSQPIMMAIFSPLAGTLSDRIEPRIVASLGMALTCLGLFVLAGVGADSSLALIVVTLIVLGFGFALFSSPNSNAIMGSVDKRFYGVASGALSTMRVIGQTLSLGISMSFIGLFIGPMEITPEHGAALVKTVRAAFLVFGAFCFGGVFASLARGKVR
ncbi:MAG: MFS transporter [Betaproteobacteria bacterium]|nr:MFS transporter [Betaproteobacteria bacterium]